MKRYYGIGKASPFKFHIAIFLGLTVCEIAFYTKKYKFIPRVYITNYSSFEEEELDNLIGLKSFFGFLKR